MFWFEPPDQHISWEYSVDNFLDNNDINLIDEYVNAHQSQLKKAEINSPENGLDYQYRRSDIMWITDTQAMSVIYNKITRFILEVNSTHFKYSLNYIEPFQYSVYDSSNQGYYDIHCDSTLRNTSGWTRKISFSILLNDSSDFKDGDLALHITKNPVPLKQQKGTIVLFPSFLPHSVSPVTEGIRKSLVGWAGGPNLV